MGVADQIVYAGLVEEGCDELCWHCVERKRGEGGGCAGNGVQMGLKGHRHRWCACWTEIETRQRQQRFAGPNPESGKPPAPKFLSIVSTMRQTYHGVVVTAGFPSYSPSSFVFSS